MENKMITEYSDLELAELQGSSYNELMRIQANLQAINQEIARRKPETKEVKNDNK